MSDIDTPLTLLPMLVGKGGRLSHFSRPQHHDVVFLSVIVAVEVGGITILGFSDCFPCTALEVGDGLGFITLATTLSDSTTTLCTSDTDPFCGGRGLMNKNAARMLERMTRDARKVRSTLGLASWLMIVKGPGSEDRGGSESLSERPWTASIAGS